jgi:hypothetical protein
MQFVQGTFKDRILPSFLPSFLSALQLRVSFGFLNSQPLSSLFFICSDEEASNGRVKK